MLIDDIRPEDHQLLLQDNVSAWNATGKYSLAHLDAWVKANTLQAIALPRVLGSWRPGGFRQPQEILFGYITVALEHLPEETKLRTLHGLFDNDLQQYIYETLLDQPQCWAVASPSWCGAPGSALRARAEQLGWTPKCLVEQTQGGIEQQEAPSWTSWMRYPHSIAVYRREELAQALVMGDLQPWVCAPWADPKDVALATLLHEHLPQLSRHSYLQLQVHAKVAPLPAQDVQELRDMVNLHVGLGMMDELLQDILRGALPMASEQLRKSMVCISYEGLLQP